MQDQIVVIVYIEGDPLKPVVQIIAHQDQIVTLLGGDGLINSVDGKILIVFAGEEALGGLALVGEIDDDSLTVVCQDGIVVVLLVQILLELFCAVSHNEASK